MVGKFIIFNDTRESGGEAKIKILILENFKKFKNYILLQKWQRNNTLKIYKELSNITHLLGLLLLLNCFCESFLFVLL